MGVNLLRKIRV